MKEAHLKNYMLNDSNYMIFEYTKTMDTVRSLVAREAGGWAVGWDEQAEHRGLLGGRNTSCDTIYNDGHMSLYFCPNPQNVQHQK